MDEINKYITQIKQQLQYRDANKGNRMYHTNEDN